MIPKKNDSNGLLSLSVSCMDLLAVKQQMDILEKTDFAFYHYDVVDGLFNQCYILGDQLIKHMKPHTKKPFEVHLAVQDPMPYIPVFAGAGADYIAVHYESNGNPALFFDVIRKAGAIPVLAYKASTPPGNDFTSLAKECPWILKLTVNPGFSGQSIQPEAIKHIQSMRKMLDNAGLSTKIQADGNVNEKTIPALQAAGANIFTGGTSGVFHQRGSLEENINAILKCIHSR